MRSLKIDRPPNGLLKATAATGGGETKDHNPPDIYPLCQTRLRERLEFNLHGIFQVILVGPFRWFWAFTMRQETMGGNSYEDKPPYF